jgi:GTPase SAR1 family protein
MQNIEIDNEHSFRSALVNGINLFIGSGFSVLSKDSQSKNLPTEQELTAELSSVFQMPYASKLGLEQVYAIIGDTQQEKLAQYIKSRFSVSSYDDRYQLFDQLAIKNIITTTIDDLLHITYSKSKLKYLNNIGVTGASFRDKTAIDFIPLRGTVLDNPIFTSITNTFPSDPDRLRVITERLQKYPTLFWGFGITDANLLQTFVTKPESTDRWIVLKSSEVDEGTLSYFRASNFQVIVSDTSSKLGYLSNVVNTLVKAELPNVSLTVEQLFPDEAIPRFETVPVRPIKEFFLGAPPTWYDIFSDNLHRTEHFRKIRNSVEDPNGKTVIIVGLPGCGKTTLLMQIAAQRFRTNYNLICEYLSLDKARLIKNRLGGAKALIFIDNFCDSLDAFKFLIEEDNIQVVGTDRNYNFDIVSHVIDREKSIVIDVTDLTDSDIQKCFQSIPESIRERAFREPYTPQHITPSLFEIIESNVFGANLRKRYAGVLQELGRDAPNLRDLLVIISYVHQARVPVTFDMLIAYWRGVISDYKEIYEMINQLESMVANIAGTTYSKSHYGEDQDYYVPRSRILSETIIESIKGSVLRTVLERFHNNVSPYRIHNFHIFKRYAFDHQIISRAFADPDEGKSFYEKLYLRDESPYLLQQAALYLSKKKKHQAAFSMIDEAINVSEGKVWSIRNSHAIILFRANINHSTDAYAKQDLKKSMDILTDCYKWDRRKPFHAITFADHAIQYSDVYANDEAYNFLKTARQWLINEDPNLSWNRNIKRLLKLVDRELGKYPQGQASST